MEYDGPMNARKGFDLDLADGQYAEGKLAAILSEQGPLVEVKSDGGLDAEGNRTGNVYVEVEYRGQPSGLATTEATWWAIELEAALGGDLWLIVKTSTLKAICRDTFAFRKEKGWATLVPGGDDKASKGVLIPVWKLVPHREQR